MPNLRRGLRGSLLGWLRLVIVLGPAVFVVGGAADECSQALLYHEFAGQVGNSAQFSTPHLRLHVGLTLLCAGVC